jgi:hypothetical protein
MIVYQYVINKELFCIIPSSEKLNSSAKPVNFYNSFFSTLYCCLIDIKGFVPKYYAIQNLYNFISWYEIYESNNILTTRFLLESNNQIINNSNIDKKLKTILTFM